MFPFSSLNFVLTHTHTNPFVSQTRRGLWERWWREKGENANLFFNKKNGNN